jgi:LAO/AO transport system kinase
MVMVETVGAGQSETDITLLSDVVLVVLTPGFGDAIQAMKAGLLEVGDAYVMNKADQPGAERAEAEIATSLEMGRYEGATLPTVASTVATEGRGVSELAEVLLKVYQSLTADGVVDARRSERVEAHVREILADHFSTLVESEVKTQKSHLFKQSARINPYQFAGALITKICNTGNDAKKD